MNIFDILEITTGVLLAQLIIGGVKVSTGKQKDRSHRVVNQEATLKLDYISIADTSVLALAAQ